MAGPGRAGRSTALRSVAESPLEEGWQLVVLTPRPSSLNPLAGWSGVRAVLEGTAVAEHTLRGVLAGPGRRLLLVDDAQLLREMDAGDWLRSVVETDADQGLGIIVAGDGDELGKGFGTWLKALRRDARALVLASNDSYQVQELSVPIARTDLATRLPLGRAYARGREGTLIQVQVPIYEEAAA